MSTLKVADQQTVPPAPLAAPARPSVPQIYEQWLGQSKRRSRRRPASRRALLMGFFVFVLLQAGFALFIACRPQHFGDPVFQARLHRLREQQARFPDRPVVAFFGSSRVLFGWDVQGMEKLGQESNRPAIAAGFDYAGGGPITQVVMWERLRREGIEPRMVLIELMPAYLSDQDFPDELEEWRLPTPRLSQDDVRCLRRFAGPHRPSLEREVRIGQLVPWYRNRFDVVNLAMPTCLPLEKRTFLGQAFLDFEASQDLPGELEKVRRRRAMAIAEKEYVERLGKLRIGGKAVAAVEELIEAAQARGIVAALVLMPEGPIFQSWYAEAKHRAVTEFAEQLQKKYAVDLVDARSWYPDESWFYDSHHLLPSTGKAFTRRLAEEHILPRLGQP